VTASLPDDLNKQEGEFPLSYLSNPEAALPEKIHSHVEEDVTKIAGPDLSAISPNRLEVARFRLSAIRPILESSDRSEIQARADEIGYSSRSLVDWRARYLESGLNLLSLLPRAGNSGVTEVRIDPRTEQIIHDILTNHFQVREHQTINSLILTIRGECRDLDLQPPSAATIYRRLKQYSPYERSAGRLGRKQLKAKFGQLTGNADRGITLLQEVELDATPVNLMIVSGDRILVLPRHHITLAIDVFSSCILGFVLSEHQPGLAEIAELILQSVMPKQGVFGFPGVEDIYWPCHGMMSRIRTDNAMYFRAKDLVTGLDTEGISLIYRGTQTPQAGPFIENFNKSLSLGYNSLPGTTFSNIQDRGEYKPSHEAVMTFEELVEFTVRFIHFYHHKKSRTDGKAPLERWQEGLEGTEFTPGLGEVRLPRDSQLFRINLMPSVERSVQRDGLSLFTLKYQHPALAPLVGTRDPKRHRQPKKFTVRYDVRNLSAVYLYNPASQSYIEVPLRNLGRPPISLDELRAARKEIRKRFNSPATEELLFREQKRMAALIESAQRATKAARRGKNSSRVKALKTSATTEPQVVQTDLAIYEVQSTQEQVLPSTSRLDENPTEIESTDMEIQISLLPISEDY
jgi:putative transposase